LLYHVYLHLLLRLFASNCLVLVILACGLSSQICSWSLRLLLRLYFLSLFNFWWCICDSFSNIISKLLRMNFIVTGYIALGEIPFSHELICPTERHSSPLLGLLINSLAFLNLLLFRLFILILSCFFNGESLG
jgi:hypothetical protein